MTDRAGFSFTGLMIILMDTLRLGQCYYITSIHLFRNLSEMSVIPKIGEQGISQL